VTASVVSRPFDELRSIELDVAAASTAGATTNGIVERPSASSPQ
jgi:hypothetical protein